MIKERVLYEGDPIAIEGKNIICIDLSEIDFEGHDLWIGNRGKGKYVLLQRGVLEQLAHETISGVSRILNNISSGQVNYHIEGDRYPNGPILLYSSLALACAQAHAKELQFYQRELLRQKAIDDDCDMRDGH